MSHLALITGANRGIGLALVREFLARGGRVIAACRAPEEALALRQLSAQCSDLRIERLDVTRPQDIACVARSLDGEPIDVLINNAGVFDEDRRLGSLDYDAWRSIIEVNLLGQVRVTETLLPNVLASTAKKVIVVSSALGSIAQSTGGRYAYRSSKAALNMVFHSLAEDLRPTGAIVALLSPGLVDTGMTRELDKQKISAEESARGLVETVMSLTPAESGAFMRIGRGVLAW